MRTRANPSKEASAKSKSRRRSPSPPPPPRVNASKSAIKTVTSKTPRKSINTSSLTITPLERPHTPTTSAAKPTTSRAAAAADVMGKSHVIHNKVQIERSDDGCWIFRSSDETAVATIFTAIHSFLAPFDIMSCFPRVVVYDMYADAKNQAPNTDKKSRSSIANEPIPCKSSSSNSSISTLSSDTTDSSIRSVVLVDTKKATRKSFRI